MDGQHSGFFFKWLAKRAKKCIEFRGEYVEYIPNFVAAVCFRLGRAKDLSAPPRMIAFTADFMSRSILNKIFFEI